jgi:serine phosphatase RsbU (regulator of sigma subunit)/predicted enzyme related to lactoylglutathione lyase
MAPVMSSSSPERRVWLDPSRLGRDDPHLQILCVNIYVRDQDESVRFYVDQLGFSLVVDENHDGVNRWVAVAPPDGSAVIALVSPPRNSPERKLIGRGKPAVLASEDVERKFNEWRKRGVKFHHPPQPTLWGGIITSFEDIDGNTFVLIGRDQFVRELERERRALTAKLEAERRAAQELEIAKQVQARLFPQTSPALGTLDYAGICIQARQVGGDYYDFLNLGRERLGLVIGDTSGKGIAAALLMANLQANLRSQSAIALDEPQAFLKSVNQLFCENTTDSSYATLVFAEYDDRSRRVRYANCGHYPGLLFRGGSTLELLESTSTVLGLFHEWECTLAENQLSPGDTLVLYTDGVTDSFNNQGEDFGEGRLIDAVRKNRKLPPEPMLARIVDEVRRFSPLEQHDDITLIVAKCRGN